MTKIQWTITRQHSLQSLSTVFSAVLCSLSWTTLEEDLQKFEAFLRSVLIFGDVWRFAVLYDESSIQKVANLEYTCHKRVTAV